MGTKVPWSRKQQPTAVFLPGKSHGQRSLAVYSLWDRKEWNTTEQLRARTLTMYAHTCSRTHTHTHTHTHVSGL